MQHAELGNLLHQAIETRLGLILQLTDRPGWLEDADAVHDVRVGSRRLRAALALAAKGRAPVRRKLRKRAKTLTTALGLTRELDVHLSRLEGLAGDLVGPGGHAVLEHVLESFDQDRRKACRRMAREVTRARLQEWADFPADPGEALGDPVEDVPGILSGLVKPMVRAALDGAREQVLRQEPEALHRLRIGTKKLRYALEILAPALPAAAAWLGRLKALQGALGDHHDWTVLEAELWNRQALLVERRRAALATGILEVLGLVVDQRQAAFAALPAAADGLDSDRALRDLCPGDSAS